MPAHRHFLPTSQPILHAVTEWLLTGGSARNAGDLGHWAVVVNGARAGRRLEQLLAEACDRRGLLLVPPQILTLQRAPSVLFQSGTPETGIATAIQSQLAWAEALSCLDLETREALGLKPGPAFSSVHLAAAQAFLRVCSSLCAHRMTPGEVADVVSTMESDCERTVARWKALQVASDRVEEILKCWHLVDATASRAELLTEGTPRSGLRLALAGVPEFDRMYEEGFARIADRCDVLIYADESSAEGFDPWGRVVPSYWNSRPAALSEGVLFTTEDSLTQAAALADWAVEAGATAPGAPRVIASPDAEEIPAICDALTAKGSSARPVALRTFGETRPWRALGLIAAYLRRDSADEPADFEVIARMVRQRDLADFLGVRHVLPALDRFHGDHLPARFDPTRYASGHELAVTMSGADGDATPSGQTRIAVKTQGDAGACPGLRDIAPSGHKSPGVPEAVLQLHANLREKLPLSPASRNLPEVAAELAALTLRIFGDLPANDTTPAGRSIFRPLKALMEEVNLLIGSKVELQIRPAELLSLLLSNASAQPVPASGTAGDVEVIGWLELLADDSPFAAVASFCEGFVPDSVVSDPFLPAGLRDRLGLASNESRLARDAYLLQAIGATRPGGALRICVPKRSAAGDPLRPSRILLQGLSGTALAARLIRLLESQDPEDEADAPAQYAGFGREEPTRAPVESLSVTDFAAYLRSPRQFYFERLLRLSVREDDALEIDPSMGGQILHEILSRFAHSTDVRDSTEAAPIRTFVLSAFRELVRVRFAGLEEAGVTFQMEAFEAKLSAFADRQAALAGEGWRIVYAESGNSTGWNRPLDLPSGQRVPLSGRIDRIDRHLGSGAWRVIDYKTSSTPKDPDKQHVSQVKSNTNPGWSYSIDDATGIWWKDLQFPLYRWLLDAESTDVSIPGWVPGTPAEFCYFQLPDDTSLTDVSEPLSEKIVTQGHAMSLVVAQAILDGVFPDSPDTLRYAHPAVRGLCGKAAWLGDAEDGEEFDE